MKNPKTNIIASIIVPTYNRNKLLRATLESLTTQTIDPNLFEVIVVDDGSADQPQQIIDQYKDRLHLQYFYQEDKGYRLSKARNQGLKLASSDLCILVDAGILLPSWGIEEHINSHKSSPNPVAVIGFLYGLVNSETSNNELAKLIDMNDLDRSIACIKSKSEYSDMREDVIASYNHTLKGLPAPWIFFWGGNVSFDKSAFSENEFYFNEVFDGNWGCEDVEFGYRLHKKNVEIILNPRAEAIHYPHEKYKGFETARMINIQKFNDIYKAPETKLLFDISVRDIDNIFLNDYLSARVSNLKL